MSDGARGRAGGSGLGGLGCGWIGAGGSGGDGDGNGDGAGGLVSICPGGGGDSSRGDDGGGGEGGGGGTGEGGGAAPSTVFFDGVTGHFVGPKLSGGGGFEVHSGLSGCWQLRRRTHIPGRVRHPVPNPRPDHTQRQMAPRFPHAPVHKLQGLGCAAAAADERPRLQLEGAADPVLAPRLHKPAQAKGGALSGRWRPRSGRPGSADAQ